MISFVMLILNVRPILVFTYFFFNCLTLEVMNFNGYTKMQTKLLEILLFFLDIFGTLILSCWTKIAFSLVAISYTKMQTKLNIVFIVEFFGTQQLFICSLKKLC